MSARVRVELGERGYDVVIGAGVLDLAAAFLGAASPAPTRALLVHDAGVPEAHADRLESGLRAAGIEPTRATLEPSERAKSLETAERLLTATASAGLDRNDVILALGGGIAGDVAGFVAATYRRGIRVVQAPTTLLAMVDASVGGKTGVNLGVAGAGGDARLLKNFVGSFHQPSIVLADVATLGSLEPRVLRCGLAECIKHAMIAGDEDLFAWTEGAIDSALSGDERVLAELVERNVAIKARVVAGDERESDPSGGRALLNLGHTFGHAIETIPTLSPEESDPGLAPLMHGEAVALGLVAAADLAVSLGRMSGAQRDRAVALIAQAGLPTAVAGLPGAEEVVARMRDDKKTLGGRVRLIVPDGLGRAGVVEGVGDAEIARAVDAIRAPGRGS